jgi:hypothetical protein
VIVHHATLAVWATRTGLAWVNGYGVGYYKIGIKRVSRSEKEGVVK